MSTFEQESDEATTDLFPVFGKPTINDSWQFIGACATVGEANTLAAAKVDSPDNFAKTRVCLPTGNLFKDVA
jgi:hypothetical protein